MASGPDAMKSSRPTLATPNHGRTSRAIRRAATRSSTSSATARRSRMSSWPSAMCRSSQLIQGADALACAPLTQLLQYPCGRPRLEEGSRPDLDGVSAGQYELHGVLSPADASDPDDGGVRAGGAAVVHGPHRAGPDGGAPKPAPAGAEPRTPGRGTDRH